MGIGEGGKPMKREKKRKKRSQYEAWGYGSTERGMAWNVGGGIRMYGFAATSGLARSLASLAPSTHTKIHTQNPNPNPLSAWSAVGGCSSGEGGRGE